MKTGTLKDLSKKNSDVVNLVKERTIGRNKDIYDLLEIVIEKKSRIIHIKGELGSGKTALV